MKRGVVAAAYGPTARSSERCHFDDPQTAVGALDPDADHVPVGPRRQADGDGAAHAKGADGLAIDGDRRSDGVARGQADSERTPRPERGVAVARRAAVPALAEDGAARGVG